MTDFEGKKKDKTENRANGSFKKVNSILAITQYRTVFLIENVFDTLLFIIYMNCCEMN